jgi:hypothetical protein
MDTARPSLVTGGGGGGRGGEVGGRGGGGGGEVTESSEEGGFVQSKSSDGGGGGGGVPHLQVTCKSHVLAPSEAAACFRGGKWRGGGGEVEGREGQDGGEGGKEKEGWRDGAYRGFDVGGVQEWNIVRVVLTVKAQAFFFIFIFFLEVVCVRSLCS